MTNTASYIPYIASGDSLFVSLRGKPFNIHSDHPSYKELMDGLASQNLSEDEVEELLNVSTALVRFAEGLITVVEGEVLYNGNTVHGTVVDRILGLMSKGDSDASIKPLVAFLDKLMENPSFNARSELYGFLEASKLPITSNGNFLAYRVVNSNYKDKHTGRMDNSIGSVVSMPRAAVDDNKQNTCSSGLHFCGYEYSKSFFRGNDRLVLVEINPKNVVSIPVDYDNQKGRCCEFTVVKDITDTLGREYFNNEYVVDSYVDDDYYDDEDYDYDHR